MNKAIVLKINLCKEILRKNEIYFFQHNYPNLCLISFMIYQIPFTIMFVNDKIIFKNITISLYELLNEMENFYETKTK